MTMTVPKIAEEVAQAEFVRMCETFRVNLDETSLTKAERTSLGELRGGIVRDMMAGRIIVGADGLPTYNAVVIADGSTKSLTFNRPTGATMMALETHPPLKQIANTMCAMVDMCRTTAGAFATLDARDVQRCMRLARLFLADQQ